jgi:transglutaminase-like putative cysteine protease
LVRFDLTIQLDYNVITPSDFVFNIQPAQTAHQSVVWDALATLPPNIAWNEDRDPLGNRHLRLHADPGKLNLTYGAIVDVRHHFDIPADVHETPVSELPSAVMPYIYPSRFCQSDRLANVAWEQFANMAPGYARVAAVRDWVNAHVQFKPGASFPSTSAVDTHRDRVGVCRDYAHLMITLLRALNIPARFVTSIDYGADPALGPTDFHATVEAYLGGRWYLFDPSGISPRMGLIRIGTGRDASDCAFATIFGTVESTMPMVRITATTDKFEGLVEPFRHDYAVSTDPGPELVSSDVNEYPATQARVMDSNRESIGGE